MEVVCLLSGYCRVISRRYQIIYYQSGQTKPYPTKQRSRRKKKERGKKKKGKMSLKTHLSNLLHSIRDLFKDCALYLPAKDSWSEEYNFPSAPMAGAGRRR
ncbi:hypothetical protein BDV32DRAFT_117162 [Aspergillus pseudonomiae]|nr:hypothetical protein BDV32DRAFT_117162 [Aspergillus pseudonomiae]